MTDPRATAATRATRSTSIAPSLPGYGFSGPTSEPGWTTRRMAGAFAEIMATLGYDRYGAQGGDWGSLVSANLADLDAAHVCGLHLNFVVTPVVPGEIDSLTAAEQASLAAMREFRRTGAGYQEIQGTKPQSLGYGLEDSPAGARGVDRREVPRLVRLRRRRRAQLHQGPAAHQRDGLLADADRRRRRRASTTRPAAPAPRRCRRTTSPSLPGSRQYPGEITKMPRRWVEQRYNVTHWAEPARGGHFAAMEVPDLYVDDVRAFFRTVR